MLVKSREITLDHILDCELHLPLFAPGSIVAWLSIEPEYPPWYWTGCAPGLAGRGGGAPNDWGAPPLCLCAAFGRPYISIGGDPRPGGMPLFEFSHCPDIIWGLWNMTLGAPPPPRGVYWPWARPYGKAILSTAKEYLRSTINRSSVDYFSSLWQVCNKTLQV